MELEVGVTAAAAVIVETGATAAAVSAVSDRQGC